MGLVHESINVNRLTEYTRKSYYRTILYAQNTLIVRYRKLVCLGEFSLRAGYSRCCISQALSAFWEGRNALCY